MTELFIVRPGNKNIVSTRTDTSRLFKISNRRMKVDRLIPKAVELSATYVAELVARFGATPTEKGKASKIRKFQEIS
jgi:hypothetical protein